MVARFSRSVSLSGGANRISADAAGASRDKSHHTRSTSLPCRFHPAVGRLKDETHSLRALAPPSVPSLAWLSNALDRIDHVHSTIADLLLHNTGTSLDDARAGPLVDGSFLLTDAFAYLQSVAGALRNHLAEARAAIRRGDPARASAAVRAQRLKAKELESVAASLKGLADGRTLALSLASGEAAELEVSALITEAVAATAAASMMIFRVVVIMSGTTASAGTSSSRDSNAVRSLRRMSLSKAFDKTASPAPAPEIVPLETMEECAEEVEKGSERVYRSLVNTRVALLNILTPFVVTPK